MSIAKERRKLDKLIAQGYSLTSRKVIAQSQKLDWLIVNKQLRIESNKRILNAIGQAVAAGLLGLGFVYIMYHVYLL